MNQFYLSPQFIAAVTLAALFFAGCINLNAVLKDLQKFRKNLKPGDYAIIKTDTGKIRGKFIEQKFDMYLFQCTDSRQKILTPITKIYKP